MRTLIKFLLLFVVILFWAQGYESLWSAGAYFSELTGVSVMGKFWIGGVAFISLVLAMSALADVCRICRGKGSGIASGLSVIGIGVIIYFGADLVAKGQALNQLTTVPVLGYLFWLLLAWFIYVQLVSPIISFCRLPYAAHLSPKQSAAFAISDLNRWLKANPGHVHYQDYLKLRNDLICAKGQANVRPEHLQDLLTKYEGKEDLFQQAARNLILNYCKVGALAVVLSRNKWVDGLALLYLQLKMVIELARLHGYKTGPIFNSLCLGWVLASSLIYVAINDCLSKGKCVFDLSGEFAAALMNSPDVQREKSSFFDDVPIIGSFVRATKCFVGPMLEATLAASNMYVVGHLYLRRLNGDKRRRFRDALEIRSEGRKQLLTILTEAIMKKAKSAGFKQDVNSTDEMDQVDGAVSKS